MSTEIAPLASVQEQIKNKIKGEFANLIPDEMWAQMVQSVVAEFTADQPHRDYNGRVDNSKPVTPSPMKKLIRDEIDAMAKAKLKAEIDKLGASTWDGYGKQVASQAVSKLIDDHFPELLASVQAGMVEMAVMQAVNHMRNSMMR
jgi:hypothetical protein